MTPAPEPDAELAALRAEVAHLQRVNAELLGTVAELRATVERQQAHIDRLVRIGFGRKSERVVTGPTRCGTGTRPPRRERNGQVAPRRALRASRPIPGAVSSVGASSTLANRAARSSTANS